MLPTPRRTVALLAGVLALPLTVALSTSSPAHADNASTLTVVGTSDVFDSGLSDNVLKPGFEAYEQSLGKSVTYNYVSRGTGAAIDYAKAGTASALVVHAASLENQFVADGYSLEPYGRAFTWGDFVLLGHGADPAGVNGATEPSHDIVASFEKIATAGAAGTARFVSRGGTPGTTVQEHAIWALTTGVPLCDVPAANGGGKSPVNANPGTAVCGSQAASPAWYTATGSNQALNVENADVCNYNDTSNANHDICYVFTDKGTFQYLRSTSAITSLVQVAANNTAPGQENLLINSFHAYAINPAKFTDNPNVQINSDAATDFLNWVTSPAGQQAIATYLATDPDGAPFRPSSTPDLTITSPPNPDGTTVDVGTSLTFSGKLVNPTPGTPALSAVPVKLMARPAGQPDATPVMVASDDTDDTGIYSISYAPKANLTYSIAVDQITKIENSTLNPPFGDILQPTSADAGTVDVRGAIKPIDGVPGGRAGYLKVSGQIAPAAAAGNPRVLVYAAKPGHTLTLRGYQRLNVGARNYAFAAELGKGTYVYQLRYTNPGVIIGAVGPRTTIKLK